MTFAERISVNPKGGEFELRCPACKGVGTPTDAGVVCLGCRLMYVEFVAQMTLPIKRKLQAANVKPLLTKPVKHIKPTDESK